MNIRNRWIKLMFSFSVIVLLPGSCSYSKFEKGFAHISHQGMSIPFIGTISIGQKGGHIQGIQLYHKGDKKVLFLSGSSNGVAYMVQAEINTEARIVFADTLMLDPYRHAGGFQIHGQYLAIGIEDNKSRNTSRVMVYDLEKEKIWSDPVHVIYRDGAYERATAGAVGITLINGYYLVAVADWDSRHMDIYTCPESQFTDGKEEFRLVDSLNMESVSRTNWVDSTWRSYQNINLFAGFDDRFYLVGFATTTGDGQNVADLYRVDFTDEMFNQNEEVNHGKKLFSLTKVHSSKFVPKGHTSFRWGAGLVRNHDGKWTLMVAPEHIDPFSKVVLYSK